MAHVASGVNHSQYLMRALERNACHIDDVDIIGRTLTICRTETGADENGNRAETVHEGAKTDAGVRIVSIPECNIPWVEEVIKTARKYSDTWLFPQEPGKWKTRYTGQRIRSSQLRRHLRDICENKLHIEYKPPHKLRKTYASILAANNLPDAMRIAQMGHTDIKTTKQFYEFDRETNAEKTQKLGEIEELRLVLQRKGSEMSPEMSPEEMLQKKKTRKRPKIKHFRILNPMETVGLEPMTSTLPVSRSPN